ncbi:MAG: deoxyguanosinetriphosphate triphosphohydrolase [Dehalococcoidales bacterium]|nr:deoxyguanosinetriphosphate triphosphohydrolase [Dehalococcoidales bacterium]
MIEQLHLREITEEKEEKLSPFAARSRLTRGRVHPEEPCPLRAAFQRDRDRIIHGKAFRRLKHKTQVFIAPLGDHYVTRLTHTLEVAQIARTISRALNLNEDLTEAIALGHDLGHTPFGHVGEEVLNELYPGGFRHNEQSLRVVDLLENDGKGLNLTREVRDGILNHSKVRENIFGAISGQPATLEGEVCKIADAIAYINHDIEDAIRAGIITEGDLSPQAISVIGASHSARINTMVCDVIVNSWSASGNIPAAQKPSITMSPRIMSASNTLRDFLFENVYNLRSAREETEKARAVIRFLYKYFNRHAGKMPVEYGSPADDVARRVVDYIAGMTDHYALRLGEELK